MFLIPCHEETVFRGLQTEKWQKLGLTRAFVSFFFFSSFFNLEILLSEQMCAQRWLMRGAEIKGRREPVANLCPKPCKRRGRTPCRLEACSPMTAGPHPAKALSSTSCD